jgi:hypothetical protein
MGCSIPEIPVVYVEAKNKGEAKELLLKCVSQYGTVTQEGFEEFADFNFDFLDFELPNISFDDFTFGGDLGSVDDIFSKEIEPKTRKNNNTIVCPKCGEAIVL